jgi:hypothetical protein
MNKLARSLISEDRDIMQTYNWLKRRKHACL